MTYRIAPNLSVDVEIRRVLQETLEEARTRCVNVTSVHEDVHEARKQLKKVRAALKIVRTHVPKYRLIKDRVRDAGRRLSVVRDAAAVVESIDILRPVLEASLSADEVDAARERLVRRRDALAAPAAGILIGLVEELDACIAQAAALEITARNADDLRGGIEREYARGRHWAQALTAQGADEDFHEWRKRAKDHRYHLELLFGESPGVDRFHELTDLLGLSQDITVLLAVLAEEAAGTNLVGALKTRREELRAAALDLGAATYGPTPSERSDEVLGRWERG